MKVCQVRKLIQVFKKAVAGFLCLSLLVPTTGFSNSAQLSHLVSKASFKIPAEFGRVSEEHVGKNGKTIFYIQDAHDSLEAQQNIARILDHLIQSQNIKKVYEEGYEGLVPTEDYFGQVESLKDREKLGQFLMDRLRMGGAEYLHLQNPKRFQLIGADNTQLHQENIKWFGETAKFRELIESQLREVVGRLKKILLATKSREAKDWLKKRDQFLNQNLGVDQYIQTLSALSLTGSHESLALKSFPQIKGLVNLTRSVPDLIGDPARDPRDDKTRKQAALTQEFISQFSPDKFFDELEKFDEAYAASSFSGRV